MAEVFEYKHKEWIDSVLQSPRNLASQEELLEQARVALKRFLEADVDSSGSLSFQELQRLCEAMGLPMEEEEEEALSKLDEDGNGSLDVQEWVLWWLRRVSALPNPLKQQEAIARNTFAKFDLDHSGYLNASELSDLLDLLGADLTPEEVAQALQEMDSDGTGSIEVDEFVAWWTNRSSQTRHPSSLISLKLRKLAAKAMRQFQSDIFRACWQGEVDLVRAFLASEPRLAQATDESEYGESWSALQYASYRGHLDIVKALLEAGAPVNHANALGFTALFYASQQGHIEVCRELYGHGGDPTAWGAHAEVETAFLCALDFIDQQPALRDLFADHKKCQTALEPLQAQEIRNCCLSAGQLVVEVSPSLRAQRSGPPLRRLRATLTATAAESLTEYFSAPLQTTCFIACKKPGSEPLTLPAAVEDVFWSTLTAGYHLHKIRTLHATDSSTATIKECWRALLFHYEALVLARRKQVVLEDCLLQAIGPGTEAADTLKAQIQAVRDRPLRSGSKALSTREVISEALAAMEAGGARKGPADPKEERKADTREAKTNDNTDEKPAGLAASSSRAPWTVTLSLSAINSLQEGSPSPAVPVRVLYAKA
eukprot:gene11273-12573_t